MLARNQSFRADKNRSNISHQHEKGHNPGCGATKDG